NLERLGFGVPGSQYTTLYGEKTKAQVEAFQKHYNLVVNGIADEVTLKKINEILNSPLQEGKSHSRTIQLKKDLEKLGYGFPGSQYTDYYVQSTSEMVKKCQKDHGIHVSGLADEITLAKIAEKIEKLHVIKIFIDPGHRRSDSGTVSGKTQEKTLTFNLA